MVWEKERRAVSADSDADWHPCPALEGSSDGKRSEPFSHLAAWAAVPLGLLSFLFPAVAEGGGPRSFLSHAEPGRAGREGIEKETLAPLSRING